jgi:5-methyltetrahydropteroyltriglutamate--homocysteine methyltransferase
MELISLLKGKDVLVGAIDVANHQIETPEQVANVLRQAMKYADIEHIHGCTNCGMVPLPREIATAKLQALVAGAELLNKELS